MSEQEKNTSHPHYQSDIHLLQRLRAGESTAFREFVRLYQRRLMTLALQLSGNREDAEDIVQEAFIKAYSALHSFNGTSALYTWLHRITVNLYIDHTRSGRYKTMASWDEERDNLSETAHLQSSPRSPEMLTNAQFQQEHIERALTALSAQQRVVFVLRYFQEYSLDEIAEELGVTVGTVKTLLFRAVRLLRDKLSWYQNELK